MDDHDGRHPSDGQSCASYGAEFFPEFQPVNNIHLGVITSSLGGFGSTQCNDPVNKPDDLDKSRLIPKVRDVVTATGEAVPDPTGHGFLEWTGVKAGADPEAALAALESDLALHVAAAGESGCGFEAPMEAWYRFLVDPAPPLGIELVTEGKSTLSVSTGSDQGILEQRAQFLRPGQPGGHHRAHGRKRLLGDGRRQRLSLAGNGWFLPTIGRPFTVASKACATNPNDPCCHTCQIPAPDGCEDTCERPKSPRCLRRGPTRRALLRQQAPLRPRSALPDRAATSTP